MCQEYPVQPAVMWFASNKELVCSSFTKAAMSAHLPSQHLQGKKGRISVSLVHVVFQADVTLLARKIHEHTVGDCSDIHSRNSCADQKTPPVFVSQPLFPLHQSPWNGPCQHSLLIHIRTRSDYMSKVCSSHQGRASAHCPISSRTAGKV